MDNDSRSSSKQAELWHVILIEVMGLFLQAILLLVLYILLCRQIANYYEQMVKTVSAQIQVQTQVQTQTQIQGQTQAPKRSEGNNDAPVSKKRESKRSAPGPVLSYRDDNDSDSDSSSDSSDSSESYPTASTSKAPQDINYSSLVFPVTGCRKPLSPEDYENIKAAGDYVNVNPKEHKNYAWNFDYSFSSEKVEYTEVAM
ncbi:regulator of hemoglobinization and erythroid cell expansion protein [Macrotis lagotis]|uniref:regulator of hemoglobinization and erythroid cell expansion protein n=1 Tax=Macrotis lagotis TaxID=92651 RepID=UPI003D696218